MLKQEQGILLLALGHPYYGRMAYNLAMSLKANDNATHITLVYTQNAIAHLNQRNMWIFDNKMQIDEASQPFGAKLLLDKFTPYDHTLYLDVDTLWVNKKSPNELFKQLKGVSFTAITEGLYNYDDTSKSDLNKFYPTWADLEEIKNVFNVNGITYQWRSELMYFENAIELFALARDTYARAHDLKTVKKFGDHIPDELAINIAANKCNILPHKYKWQPTYWDRLHVDGMPSIDTLQSIYYLISCGSNSNGGALKRIYDRICAASAYKLKLQHVFPLISKKEMITSRQLI